MLKRSLKTIFFAICLVLVAPLVALAGLEALLCGRREEHVFTACKELLAAIPTLLGGYCRTAFYWAACEGVARDTQFLFGSMVAHRDIRIGSRSGVGPYSIVGHANLGRNVIIGARVSILSGKYQHGRPADGRGMERVPLRYDRLTIGDNCWIGEGAIVMANIGTGCTVGAGSVVVRDVPDGATVFGNPARRVSYAVEPMESIPRSVEDIPVATPRFASQK